jgi:hypothetical protein
VAAAEVLVAFLALSAVFAGALEAAVEAGALEAVETGLGAMSDTRNRMELVEEASSLKA